MVESTKMEIPKNLSILFSDLTQDLMKIITKVRDENIIHNNFDLDKKKLLLYFLEITAEMSSNVLDYLDEEIGKHPDTSTKLLAVIANFSNGIVRYLVAVHKNTSDDVLIKLKDDSNPIIAEAAIENLKNRSLIVKLLKLDCKSCNREVLDKYFKRCYRRSNHIN